MSGVAKGIGKVFKKVVDVGIKIAPYALAAGAIYFTCGAALGVPALAGGWGAAAGGLGTTLAGGSGVLASTLGGAITTAGYGALAGGAGSLLTGGKLSQGLTMGALVGGAAGGLLGAATAPAASGVALSGGTGSGTLADTAHAGLASGALTDNGVAVGDPLSGAAGTGLAGASGTDMLGAVANPATVGASASPGILGQGGWVERNPILAGLAVQGIGQGLMHEDPAAAQLKIDKEQSKRIAANYGSGNVPGYGGFTPVTSGPTPEQRFGWMDNEYVYDPQQQRVVARPKGKN
jgi:hypothetical protein